MVFITSDNVGGHRGLCGEVANEGPHTDPSTRTHRAAVTTTNTEVLQSELTHTHTHTHICTKASCRVVSTKTVRVLKASII